jgi:hypothetical protein
MGSGADAQLAEPFPSAVGALAEEGGELLCTSISMAMNTESYDPSQTSRKYQRSIGRRHDEHLQEPGSRT